MMGDNRRKVGCEGRKQKDRLLLLSNWGFFFISLSWLSFPDQKGLIDEYYTNSPQGDRMLLSRRFNFV